MNAIPSKAQEADPAKTQTFAGLLECPDGKLANAEPGSPVPSALPGNSAVAADRLENLPGQPAGLCGPALEALLASLRPAKVVLGQAMCQSMNRLLHTPYKEDIPHGKS